MSNAFARDPFDIAPRASRPTRAAWLTLGLGIAFLVVCAWPLGRSFEAVNSAEQISIAKSRQLRAKADSETAARMKQNNPAALEKIKAQQGLHQALRASWSGLFEALESAAQEVRGGTTVLSLVPVKIEGDAAQVGITAMAVSAQAMVDYMEALQDDTHVRGVQLVTQQPAKHNGTEVVRFKIDVLWDPRVTTVSTTPALAPTAASTRRGL